MFRIISYGDKGRKIKNASFYSHDVRHQDWMQNGKVET